MSEYGLPLCSFCKHFHEKAIPIRPFTCDAFPDGIPDSIYFECGDHRKPIDGDHGIQFDMRSDLSKELKKYFEIYYGFRKTK